MSQRTNHLLLGYAGYCVAMTVASRVLPALPDKLVPLFNLLQRLNVLLYLPNSPALLAVTSAQSTPIASTTTTNGTNTTDYTLPQLTIDG